MTMNSGVAGETASTVTQQAQSQQFAEKAPASDLLILTATITPPGGVPQLVRTDPQARLNDYLDALAFYMSLPEKYVGRILFVDNSLSDISRLHEMIDIAGQRSRVVLHTFSGLDHPPSYGRGYGEFKLLDHAIDHIDELAPQWNHPDARIWKVTGRYKVRNLSRLIRSAPQRDLYCDLKNKPQPWMDLRVFQTTLRGYRNFFYNIRESLREDVSHRSPEIFFREHVGRILQDHPRMVAPRLRVEPYVDGLRGSDNRNYSTGRNMMKFTLRSVMRNVLPGLWI